MKKKYSKEQYIYSICFFVIGVLGIILGSTESDSKLHSPILFYAMIAFFLLGIFYFIKSLKESKQI